MTDTPSENDVDALIQGIMEPISDEPQLMLSIGLYLIERLAMLDQAEAIGRLSTGASQALAILAIRPAPSGPEPLEDVPTDPAATLTTDSLVTLARKAGFSGDAGALSGLQPAHLVAVPVH